jgi:hypothetical protein
MLISEPRKYKKIKTTNGSNRKGTTSAERTIEKK